MDAGVPIKAPVAGIAMGLVYDEGKYTTLTDILGAEDAFGDMDFKVAGTADFVTALQLDTKIDGLPADVLGAGAAAGPRGPPADPRGHEQGDRRRRATRSGATAPKIVSFEIPIDKIGEVIGPKGKVINAIQHETGADISVDDDGTVGTVTIGSVDGGAVAEAKRQIQLILNPPTADVGEVYKGRVVNITKFGAFVNILPGRDGLLHISKMGGGKRIDQVEDVLDLGDEIEVRVDDVDPQGKVSLSPVTPLGGGDGAATAPRPAPRHAPRDRVDAAPPGDGRARRCRSRTPSTPSCARSSATSARPKVGGDRAAAATRGDRGGRGRGGGGRGRVATVAADDLRTRGPAHRPGQRHPRRHRADAGGPVGDDRLLGRRRRPRRSPPSSAARRTSSSTCCSRAPSAAQRARDRRGGRRRRRRDERVHVARAHRVLHAAARPATLDFGLELLCDVLSAPGARDRTRSTPSAR